MPLPVAALHQSSLHGHGPPMVGCVEPWDDAQRAALVALLRLQPDGLSWGQIVTEVIESGSAVEVWRRHQPSALFDLGDDLLKRVTDDIAEWNSEARFRFLTFLDDDYPVQLREIHQVPPVLFTRGAIAKDRRAVSVVGSRKASDRGTAMARTLATELVRAGITVISGLAEGIDTSAHTAALEAGGRTVAVIGTGINVAFPAKNRLLQEQIATEGLVLSQFWPDAGPQRFSFPMRNAVMSGYGQATVVVEAGEKSGARIQARMAVEHGRPVVLSRLVVDANEWARALCARPGVYVAGSVEDVLAVVDEVVSVSRQVDELLAAAQR